LFLIPLLGYFMSRHDEPRQASVQVPAQRADIPAARVPERPVGTTSVPSAPARVEVYRIEFDNGSRMLAAASSEQLRNVVEFLKANPKARIAIAGYTDDAGSDVANMALSQERATAVMNRLASLGIDRSRMTAEGYGESHPVADNATAEGRQHNRRVEIRVTEQ
jgi:outer membrane protein OmpA-like peptidoglycan-associated protein